MQEANSAHAEHLASNRPLEDVLRREEMVTAVELGAEYVTGKADECPG